LELGRSLQKEVATADTPIQGHVKEKLYQLMDFNTLPFESTLHRFPEVMDDCKRLRGLFEEKSITYRKFLDIVLHMVEAAETCLMKENPALSRSFGPDKDHQSTVDSMCRNFPKICQIPRYAPKGLFSLELLWNPMRDATLTDGYLESVVWPFAICPEWTSADNKSVGPASVGRHDRVHLEIFASELAKLFSKTKNETPQKKISFDGMMKGIDKSLQETTNEEDLRHLSMILFYGLHEALPRFYKVLEKECSLEIKQLFLDRLKEVLGPDSKIQQTLLKDALDKLSKNCNSEHRKGFFRLSCLLPQLQHFS